MKIRRYMGSNAQEAILKVKMDLGNEAIILNTRKVRKKGLFNMFAKPLVEVLAAIDDDYSRKKDSKPKEVEEMALQKIKKETVPFLSIGEKDLLINSEKKEEKISKLENKVSSMETMLNKIYQQMLTGSQKETKANQEVKQQKVYPKVLQQFYENLLKNEVEEEIATRIADTVDEKLAGNAGVNEIASLMYNVISGVLGKPETIKIREDKKPTVVIFVGPTGVGKTTTLAKIAANYSLNLKKNVGLITADTYRIAAVEQLKTYAEILGMPVNVIYSPNEIKDAIEQFSDKDLVLIDTAGRSYRDKSQFEELKSLISASEADEIYLVLSTTTSVRNCREIVSNYDFLKDYKLIFTKLDETPINGVMLNAIFYTKKGLSYFATGQCVPDDIEVANIDKITKNLLGSIS
jgi:flagellar biosynthesis protein FlhF